jgi:hypothetical protein
VVNDHRYLQERIAELRYRLSFSGATDLNRAALHLLLRGSVKDGDFASAACTTVAPGPALYVLERAMSILQYSAESALVAGRKAALADGWLWKTDWKTWRHDPRGRVLWQSLFDAPQCSIEVTKAGEIKLSIECDSSVKQTGDPRTFIDRDALRDLTALCRAQGIGLHITSSEERSRDDVHLSGRSLCQTITLGYPLAPAASDSLKRRECDERVTERRNWRSISPLEMTDVKLEYPLDSGKTLHVAFQGAGICSASGFESLKKVIEAVKPIHNQVPMLDTLSLRAYGSSDSIAGAYEAGASGPLSMSGPYRDVKKSRDVGYRYFLSLSLSLSPCRGSVLMPRPFGMGMT